MHTNKTAKGIGNRFHSNRLAKERSFGRNVGRKALAVAALFCALGSSGPLFAQTSYSQLTIGKNTEMSSLSDEYSSILFNGSYALTLVEGQTLRTVLVSKESGAKLVLGDPEMLEGQTWTITANSPSWIGEVDVLSGNSLVVNNGIANPLGAYSETSLENFGVTSLYDGAALRIPAKALNGQGEPAPGEVKIGALMTDALNDSEYQDDAFVEVGKNQTLIVEDGLHVDKSVGLSKTGSGTLKFLVNGSESKTISSSKSEKIEEDYVVTTFELGNTSIYDGTFTIADGAMSIDKTDITASSIYVGDGATLDIQRAGLIELAGQGGQCVLDADDGSQIDLYVDGADKTTSYVATTYNTYISLGKTNLNVVSSIHGAELPTSMTVFSTEDVGQTLYTIDDIQVTDNLLGKNYVVDKENSTAEKLILTLEKSKGIASVGKTPNERAAGKYLDNFIASDNYNDSEYKFLNRLESADSLSLARATGELHASTVGYMYLNSLTTQQTLFDMLRNNTLVAFSGDSSVAPMDYGGGAYGSPSGYPNDGGYFGGAAGGAFDNGQLYYNNDTNSYGPGVVPINNTGAYQEQPVFEGGVYNGETYGSGVGGMSGGSYYPPEGSYDAGGNYNFGWQGVPQKSTLAAMRGQDVTYGDPGTLIYSAWFAALGGAPDAEVHKDAYAYNGKQAGFLTGLDLFCSCDCRFGAYYGYQYGDMKNVDQLGELKTDSHMLGLYHQFGDETVYSIGNIHGGFDTYKTERSIDVLDTRDLLTAKYHGWNVGASFEHGANFAARPFVFSPYASVDYNWFLRRKFSEDSSTNSGYALNVGKSNYHSLRGQVGGRIAVDMYPGDQQLRLVGRAAYVHEFLNPMYGKTTVSYAALSDAAGGFNVYGNSLGRDWCLVGAGLDWTPAPALVLFAKGDYLFNKYVHDPWTTLGLKFRW